jgi:F0F1-type ATP synthase assembly protein I
MNRYNFSHPAYSILLVQTYLVLGLGLLLGIWQFQIGIQFLLGGLIGVGSNRLVYCYLFASFGATQAKKTVRDLYCGVAIKWLLTSVAFAGLLKLGWGSALPLFLGYWGAIIAFGLATLGVSWQHNNRKIRMQ